MCQGIGFYLCLLYLPDDSTTSRVGTYSPTWAEPSTASILTTAFFLGLGSVLYKVITRRSSPSSCAFLAAGTNSREKIAQNLQRRLDVSKSNRLTNRTYFPRGGKCIRFLCALSGSAIIPNRPFQGLFSSFKPSLLRRLSSIPSTWD